MAGIALNKKNPVELRARMFAELAQCVAPKRKALEHSEPGLIEELLSRIDAWARLTPFPMRLRDIAGW